jgi:CDP-glucose 4,6-dehydratase
MKHDLNTYKKLKVLVTGSTGFKGSWLCFWLNLLNAEVIGVSLKPEKGSLIFDKLKLKSKIIQRYLDIGNFNKINNLIKKEKPDIIFHLAAQSIVSSSYKDPLQTINSNVLGSANILESTRINKIKNLVYITSDKCYLNDDRKKGYKENDKLGGKDIYSSSKAASEIIFYSYHKSFFNKNKKLKYGTARAGNVIGGGDMKKNRIVPDIVKSIYNKKSIYLRNPTAVRPWQHVLESLYGYLILGKFLINKKLPNNKLPSWNFGPDSSNYKNVFNVTKTIISTWGLKKKIIKVKKIRFNESTFLKLNSQKANNELKWHPILNFNETIKLTVDWYKALANNDNLETITQKQIEFFLKKRS